MFICFADRLCPAKLVITMFTSQAQFIISYLFVNFFMFIEKGVESISFNSKYLPAHYILFHLFVDQEKNLDCVWLLESIKEGKK